MRWSVVAVVLALAVLPVKTAFAQGQVFQDISPNEMAQLMQQWGYPTEIESLSDGSQVIRSNARGLNFDVNFFNCGEGKFPRCSDLQWQIAFNIQPAPTVESFNQWNTDWRFARAYLYQGQYSYMEIDLRVTGGVSEATIEEYTRSFETMMGEFATHVGW
ncbi:MAG: YbjN domain-containing protein [Rhodospirillaceae bacterium]|nr:YbjN domain-containing protein [Rhodospirillaceae bacterium]